MIAQAQSGTGKTGAFTVGCLNLIDTNVNSVQAIIMSPTRELAIQTNEVLKSLGSYVKKLNIELCIGGNNINTHVTNFKYKVPHIIVGCPGRIYDLIRRNYLHIF